MTKKIRTKLVILLLVMAASSLLLFRWMWYQKWDIWYFLTQKSPVEFEFLPEIEVENFFDRLSEEAAKYTIPESEDDKEAVRALKPFFDLADDYTGIYIYGLEDGLYRAGRAPYALSKSKHHELFRLSYEWTEGAAEQPFNFPVEFKNGYATVMVFFYHSTLFVLPYFLFCLAVCAFVFLTGILYFVNRKMKVVERLKEEILEMAAGNLEIPLKTEGKDELGVLARELDRLRMTLNEKLTDEQEIHRSNQELIAALSHDLRTPLTILKGYLEILKLGRNQKLQEEYIGRCIRKTEDIQELTNRMFEYALVYDEANPERDDLKLVRFSQDSILAELKEHADFLELAGFQTVFQLDEAAEKQAVCVLADEAMLKRVFNNLFSNIIKYADKKVPVQIRIMSDSSFCITIQNKVKEEKNHMESNRIGLKSVRKIMGFMGGTLELIENEDEFVVKLGLVIE